MAKELWKGNEALAEAAVRAGCRIFAGYPITPQSEILEYLSWRMPEVGGTFVQTESEIAGISMVYGAAATGFRALTSSSGPGFTLKQEGISYIASAELPCVVVDVARYGSGLGDIYQAQGDYFQAVKGGGHGDYRVLVYAPASVQENADLTYLAFDKAEQYLNPVLILSDGAIGQMMEAVELPPCKTHDPDRFPWAMTGNKSGKHKQVTTRFYYDQNGDIKAYEAYLRDKYRAMGEQEQRWEAVQVEDAEVLLVGYGISARICKEAVHLARKSRIKLGLIRPVTLFPFPTKAFAQLPDSIKGILSVEMSCLGQLIEDVALATKCAVPAYSFLSGGAVPETEDILEAVKDILRDTRKAVY
ncbi:3-methyl-2-oxobutanoate dehydrogenase subunit VorB [Candidatus Formimonas warabiya]|uniref:3-methyl-2-oxobutanoate dehydrogenase subunit VorB n=1 Tax=Formimonas warabiya TaxID=1761012 RepID=A0A3G1L035_FORW1|nr:3-methyl-2-oxobutanoate dehydrogenase subunit VorB [Candidatus Formimonas warabiya]ATW28146.1 3-methyl-2-oxobutanoate dehydrogenase subunit VorB [Candidatus Formimonas warabiya]